MVQVELNNMYINLGANNMYINTGSNNMYIQGVTGGTDQTSGGCSLC